MNKHLLIAWMVICLGGIQPAWCQEVISRGDTALHYGVHEIRLHQAEPVDDAFAEDVLRVRYTRPDGSVVETGGYYAGEDTFVARAYCDTVGQWRYGTRSRYPSLNDHTGTFTVVESSLPGKLRIHPDDPFQFAYDNADWFLHIGDTGYRYVVASEPLWKEYMDEAARAGFTKIRTWFARHRHQVDALFLPGRDGFNLDYWDEIGRRVRYALEAYPHIILQLIPYAEDTEELKRYGRGDRMARRVMAYAQARWSSFPNVHWEISNDREIVDTNDLSTLRGREISRQVINRIGMDTRQREPWGTLLTNQQNRFAGYSFVDEPWSDIITLEDLDQVDGALIAEYRARRNQPVVMDEDRYETYRGPVNARYFFRRYLWASLLSGGHATYGGLKTFEAYDGGPVRGVQGYFTANQRGTLAQGAHDFRHIHSFFNEANLTLVGFTPQHHRAGDNPRLALCAGRTDTWIVYAANPDGNHPRTDNPRIDAPELSIDLPADEYRIRWFNPRTGEWTRDETVSVEGTQSLEAPREHQRNSCDWVILIESVSG